MASFFLLSEPPDGFVADSRRRPGPGAGTAVDWALEFAKPLGRTATPDCKAMTWDSCSTTSSSFSTGGDSRRFTLQRLFEPVQHASLANWFVAPSWCGTPKHGSSADHRRSVHLEPDDAPIGLQENLPHRRTFSTLHAEVSSVVHRASMLHSTSAWTVPMKVERCIFSPRETQVSVRDEFPDSPNVYSWQSTSSPP